MTVGEKILKQRKVNNLSQENLAARIHVSPSKLDSWEESKVLPDLDDILALSRALGVSTDYLLKDGADGRTIRKEDFTRQVHLSKDQVEDYLENMDAVGENIARSIAIFILSPIPYYLLTGLADHGFIPVNKGLARSLGFVFFFALVALAISTMVKAITRKSSFDYLREDMITMDLGLELAVRKKRSNFMTYFKNNVSQGIYLTVAGTLPPLFLAGIARAGIFEDLSYCVFFGLGAVGMIK